ncbi:MAG: hypothetical protein AB4426_20015 [Xenococcaceae cyanobacterium]
MRYNKPDFSRHLFNWSLDAYRYPTRRSPPRHGDRHPDTTITTPTPHFSQIWQSQSLKALFNQGLTLPRSQP